ncbi:MAG: hypothetical protein GEV13_32605 [Rhodospirillales bacterium]|nr:hypothetical protein [Rhodospirillales bacterium]
MRPRSSVSTVRTAFPSRPRATRYRRAPDCDFRATSSLVFEGAHQANPRRPDRRGDSCQPRKPGLDRCASTMAGRGTSKQAIPTPADLKGVKVRVQQSGIWAGVLRTLGAEPVVAPAYRVYVNLQSGVIDTAEHNWPSYASLRHYQVAPHLSLTEHSMAVLVFSKRVWDTPSADEQTIIRDAARDSVPVMRRLWDDYVVSAERTVEKAGGEIVRDVDRKAFADQLVPLYPTIIGDARLRSIGAAHSGRRTAGAVRAAHGLSHRPSATRATGRARPATSTRLWKMLPQFSFGPPREPVTT